MDQRSFQSTFSQTVHVQRDTIQEAARCLQHKLTKYSMQYTSMLLAVCAAAHCMHAKSTVCQESWQLPRPAGSSTSPSAAQELRSILFQAQNINTRTSAGQFNARHSPQWLKDGQFWRCCCLLHSHMQQQQQTLLLHLTALKWFQHPTCASCW